GLAAFQLGPAGKGVVAAGGATGGRGVAGAGGGFAGKGGAAGGGGAATGGACQSLSIRFTPRAPSVEILVDRASPQFTTATTGNFFDLRAALLDAVAQYQSEMRIGFAAYVGDPSTGVCALNYTSVPIASQNAAAIQATYGSLGPVQPFGSKSEVPASAALPNAANALLADAGTGDKFILFGTTGNTDFCDDVNVVCPTDDVVGRLQIAFASGLRTVVVGLPTTIPPAALQSFANAGAGQPVSLPAGATTTADIYSQCSFAATWNADWTAAGRTGTSAIATYAASAGTAPFYRAGAASTPDLPSAVNTAFASMRACLFDLATFQIDPAKVSEGQVSVDGTPLPLDPTAGWSMPNPTTVRLNGQACASWRTPGGQKIGFAFPCDAVQTR
ncbi:MAG TPA: hypothetical protein VHM31_08800, partial [Polyangia bacterium]|nr:hypothetical protein [Polyangia bacterium]